MARSTVAPTSKSWIRTRFSKDLTNFVRRFSALMANATKATVRIAKTEVRTTRIGSRKADASDKV